MYDRSVVASETGKWITSDLAILTLEKALHSQKKKPVTLYCQKNGITQSMSAAGCPYDNAPMERYYNTFKAELINHFNSRTDEELAHAISEFAYVWYNQVRPHSYNNYRTPYETRYGSGRFRQECYKNADHYSCGTVWCGRLYSTKFPDSTEYGNEASMGLIFYLYNKKPLESKGFLPSEFVSKVTSLFVLC